MLAPEYWWALTTTYYSSSILINSDTIDDAGNIKIYQFWYPQFKKMWSKSSTTLHCPSWEG